MKRKHSSTSSQKGCQIISKFFKTSERQDIHDAARLKEANSSQQTNPSKSLVAPVLKKLNKLREALINKTSLSNKTDNDNEEEKMSNSTSENENNSKDSDNLAPCLNEEVATSFVCIKDQQPVKGSTHSLDGSDLQNLNSPKSSAPRSHSEIRQQGSLSFCDKPCGSSSCKSNEENKENLTSVSKDTDIARQSSEMSLVDEMLLDSEGSLLDTEGNFADDEDGSELNDLLMSEHESPLKKQLFQVSNKLSNMTNDTKDLSDIDIGDSKYIQKLSDQTDCFSAEVQSAKEKIHNSDSDSDDDLLTPPDFLSENKSNLELLVRTPEKLTTPQGASPLCSPIKPARDMKKELDERKFKFSLQKMVNKSKKTEAKDAELSQMQADLEAGIKKGGVKTMTCVISEDDTDTDLDDGKDLTKCNLQELSRHLVKVTDFSEELVGEEIFPEFCSAELEEKLPYLNFPDPVNDDKFLENLIQSKPSRVKEDICGGWFLQYYLKRPCPAPLAEWVFNIMCIYPDIYLSTHCFKTLWALLRAGYQEQNGIPKGIRGISNWIPTIGNIIDVLYYYGATKETLSFTGQSPSFSNNSIAVKKETKPSLKQSSFQLPLLLFYVRQLVQIVTHAIYYGQYMESDLPILLGIMCRLSLDLKLQELLFDFEVCISEILNSFGNAQWEEQIKLLSETLVMTSTHHRNLLHIMQVLPPSPRGCKLRQLTCTVLLKFFVVELCNSGSEVKNADCRTEELKRLCQKAAFELNELSSLVEQIKPRKIPDCDNYLLHTIIFLFDLAVGPEEYPSSDRVELKNLASKLNRLNSEIKDPRAKFLDRTKVKDLIVRTVYRINWLVGTIKPVKEKALTNYFEVNSSNYTVLALKDSGVSPSNDDEGGSSNPSSREGSRGPSPVSLRDDLSDKELDELI